MSEVKESILDLTRHASARRHCGGSNGYATAADSRSWIGDRFLGSWDSWVPGFLGPWGLGFLGCLGSCWRLLEGCWRAAGGMLEAAGSCWGLLEAAGWRLLEAWRLGFPLFFHRFRCVQGRISS